MNSCESRTADLKAYADGELSLPRRLALHWHLTRCASCREEIKRMEHISSQLRAGEGDNSLDSALRAKILAGVPADAPPSPDSALAAKPVPKWKRRPLLIWGTAAVAVLAWFTIIFPMMKQQPFGKSISGFARDAHNPESSVMPTTELPDVDRKQMQTVTNGSGAFRSPSGSFGGGSSRTYSVSPTDQSWTGSPSTFGGTITHTDSPTVTLGSNEKIAEAKKAGARDSGVSYYGDIVTGKAASPAPKPVYERQVHREASITVEVDNPEGRSDQVEEFVKEVGGYVASNEVSTGDDNLKTASLTVKVPVQQFDETLRKIAKLGNVKAKNVNGEDITEQTSDKQQAVRQLTTDIHDTQDKLKQRLSRSAAEEYRQDLRDMKIQIAQEQARLEMLRKMAALSTITVELHEKSKPAPPIKTGGFLDDLKETGHDAISSFMQAARLPVITLIWLLAYSPVLLLLAVTYRYAVRR